MYTQSIIEGLRVASVSADTLYNQLGNLSQETQRLMVETRFNSAITDVHAEVNTALSDIQDAILRLTTAHQTLAEFQRELDQQ